MNRTIVIRNIRYETLDPEEGRVQREEGATERSCQSDWDGDLLESSVTYPTWHINEQQAMFIAKQCYLTPEEGCTIAYHERLCPHSYLNVRFKHLLDPPPDTGMPPVVFRGARGIIHEDDMCLREGGRTLGCVACNSDIPRRGQTDLPQFQPALAVATS
ncbi:hypothetical protein DL766_000286 [Monosporascus sp. MC13-8B]|uniref:Uncharacterized protein n=1 Tax=Monosporascus cannonballus TaxID=155416 RepID=A0ABY0GY45_9PEZI|nr:hypothetical protein DL762_008119 [Monosporascus cannonballus]RYO86253.1 hypothetical protein DL763_006775 [Monosporascus cannonballus]RYP39624.1 hypothetical protein DL766_000286 [Monosporascus sp. MC13-8B]